MRAVIITLFLISGCASHMAVMKNEKTGDVKTCQTGTSLAYSAVDLYHRHEQTACIDALKQAGYKQVK